MKSLMIMLLLISTGCATTYSGQCKYKNKVYDFKKVTYKQPYKNEIWVQQDEHFYLSFDVNSCKLVRD